MCTTKPHNIHCQRNTVLASAGPLLVCLQIIWDSDRTNKPAGARPSTTDVFAHGKARMALVCRPTDDWDSTFDD